jgi:hypothetical protein
MVPIDGRGDGFPGEWLRLDALEASSSAGMAGTDATRIIPVLKRV